MNTMYPKEYFTRKRIKVGTKGNFADGMVTERFLEILAESGLDWVVLTPNNARGEVRDMILDFCDEHGIEVYMDEKWLLEDFSLDADYKHHPSYCGTYCVDEPGTDEMPALAEVQNKYLEETGRMPFANLLPMYANAAQLKYGADVAAIEYYDPDPDLYEKYCRTWMALTKCDFISVDIYPFHTNETYDQYVENLNIFSRVAREYGKDTNLYLQACGWRTDMRHPSLADLRFQVYSGLSFGFKSFVYWCYTPGGFSYMPYHLVHQDGTPSHIYYYAKESIAEVKRLNDVYLSYKNIGAFNFNCTEKTPYLRMTNPTTFPTIAEIKSDDPLLIGCFEANEGNGKAFTVVNMNDNMSFKKASAKIALDKDYKVTAWYNGYPTELSAIDGYYTVNLDSGEGVFITLE